MLQLYIRGTEDNGKVLFDESTNKFLSVKGQFIQLEHSLLSISAWESKWKVPFLNSPKNAEQTIDYIRCMTLTPNVNPLLYQCIGVEEIKKVQAYIDDNKTATWFNNKDKSGGSKIVTSERLYSWMVVLGIPFECQTWHLSRLLVLIRACDELNAPPKKMSRSETAAYYKQKHAAQRASRGRR